jgi:transcriptional regulator with XRE-family HTH domain
LAPPAPSAERDQLEQLDDYLEKFIDAVRGEVEDVVDREQVERLVETARKLGLRLDERLPPTLDPAVSSEIRQILLGGIRRLDELGDHPIDLLDDFLVRAESIRHIVRDALDEDVSSEVDIDSKEAVARWLVGELDGVSRRELAELAGVDVRTFQRWLGGIGGGVPHHAQVLVKLVAILRTAWTPKGVAAWLKRPRHDLRGAAPADLMSDPSLEPELLRVARRGRAQHGA